jgi:adenylate kinase
MAVRPGPATALILFGPPGSGKGTQAKLLQSCMAVPHISTGDMLRHHIEIGDDLGVRVKSVMAAGRLVPDELVNKLVAVRVARPDAARGFILDGYPRTVQQAEVMGKMLEERKFAPVVVHLKVDYNRIINRLSGRRVCPVCGTLYSLGSNPPKIEGICDKDGARLVTREDDSEPVVRRRLEEYDVQTKPLVEYFREHGVPYYEVDGNDGAPPAIATRICELMKRG